MSSLFANFSFFLFFAQGNRESNAKIGGSATNKMNKYAEYSVFDCIFAFLEKERNRIDIFHGVCYNKMNKRSPLFLGQAYKNREENAVREQLTPSYMFGSYREVTPQFLQSIGVRALLSDVDNTLAPYEEAEPDAEILAWVSSMKAAGIRVALISNNKPPRIERFNRELGLPAYPESGKPGRRGLVRAMRELGVTPEESAMLGDQLLTDCYAGRRLGLPAIIVPPIRDKRTLFFRCKRFLERPFIRRYAKRHGRQEWMSFWKVK